MIKRLLAVLTVLSALAFSVVQAQDKPNILFIAVDDLNCDFGAYGNPLVKSPSLDELAAEGVLFTNNHAQQAVCGASRASMLSGFTPEHTGITSFRIYLRDLYPDVVTLPQFFKNNGYHTAGMGKIHDPRNVSLTDKVDLISWTEFIDIAGNAYVTSSGKPVTEMADVDDDAYTDGRIADEGIRQIAKLSGGANPFFIAVGFKKPHLPFSAPKKYWDLYDRDSISLAPFQEFAENDLEFVHNPGAELINGYDDVPAEGSFSADLQREYIHGYYACVSYIDSQVGKLIKELKQQGVYDNTIIVLWGDHGFSLGDHTNWGKHTNFEYATRCPLIIKAPGKVQGEINQSPSELLDIYPTLIELAGFQIPDTLDGNSLVPILDGTSDEVKAFAISQFKRGGKKGFSLRSEYYQYVEWRNDDVVDHRQLFNFVNDPYQTNNICSTPEGVELVDTFSIRLNTYLETGENRPPLILTEDADSLGIYRNYHYVEFNIYEDYNDKITPVKDVKISLDRLKLPTSSMGYAALQLQPGNYSYSLEKQNYFSKDNHFLLSNDTIIIDTLKRTLTDATIAFSVKSDNTPVINAEVAVNDTVKLTDSSGLASFYDLPVDSVYDYTITKENYEIQSGTMVLRIDTTVDVELDILRYNLEFQIIEEATQQSVTGAHITIGDRTGLSDIAGMATFLSFPAGNYEYTIEEESYQNYDGNCHLTADTSIVVELKWPLHILQSESDQVLIYPNPATSELKVRSPFPITHVYMTDICGKTIFQESCSRETSISLDITFLASGLYFIGIENSSLNRRHQEIITKQ